MIIISLGNIYLFVSFRNIYLSCLRVYSVQEAVCQSFLLVSPVGRSTCACYKQTGWSSQTGNDHHTSSRLGSSYLCVYNDSFWEELFTLHGFPQEVPTSERCNSKRIIPSLHFFLGFTHYNVYFSIFTFSKKKKKKTNLWVTFLFLSFF